MHEARGDAAEKGAQKYQGEGMSGAAGMSCLWRHDSVTVGADGAPSRVAVARLEGFRRIIPLACSARLCPYRVSPSPEMVYSARNLREVRTQHLLL